MNLKVRDRRIAHHNFLQFLKKQVIETVENGKMSEPCLKVFKKRLPSLFTKGSLADIKWAEEVLIDELMGYDHKKATRFRKIFESMDDLIRNESLKPTKIKVSFDIQLPNIEPDKGENLQEEYVPGITWEMSYIIQTLFDNFINYASCKHQEESIECLVDAEIKKAPILHLVHEHHHLWASILRNAEKSMKVEKISSE